MFIRKQAFGNFIIVLVLVVGLLQLLLAHLLLTPLYLSLHFLKLLIKLLPFFSLMH